MLYRGHARDVEYSWALTPYVSPFASVVASTGRRGHYTQQLRRGLNYLRGPVAVSPANLSGLDSALTLDAPIAPAFSLTADLSAVGEMATAVPVQFNSSLALSQIKNIGQVLISFDFGVSATMGTELPVGTPPIAVAFTVTPNLTQESLTDITATSSFAFSTVADLTAAGNLATTSAMEFTAPMVLQDTPVIEQRGHGVLLRSGFRVHGVQTVVSLNADIAFIVQAAGLQTSMALDFTTPWELTGPGDLTATAPVAFQASYDLRNAGDDRITTLIPAAFTVNASGLRAVSDITATMAAQFGVTANLVGVLANEMLTFISTSFDVPGDLVGVGELETQIAFSINASTPVGGPADVITQVVFDFSTAFDVTAIAPLQVTVPTGFAIDFDITAERTLTPASIPLAFTTQFKLSQVWVEEGEEIGTWTEEPGAPDGWTEETAA